MWRQEHPFSLSLSEQAKPQLMKQNVTAILCGNDLIAMGVIQYLQEHGVLVPSSVSVVGFDDIQFSKIISPALTTIRLPIAQMGIEAVNLLIKRLRSSGEVSARESGGIGC